MNKKILLTVIPAMMVLSGCNPLSDYAAAGVKMNLFAEDTLAHDEVFKSADGGLKKALPFRANGANSSEPRIAIQTMNESEGYVSIRYVADVKIKDGDLANTSAVWTRTMYEADGDVVTGKEEDDFESTKAYTLVNDGGYALSIEDFPGYTHFVVYTMRNIPLATASDYLLNVSLSLDNSVDDTYDVETNIYATSVNLNKRFSFPKNQRNYFLEGRINGVDNATVPTIAAPDGSVARFENNFASGDSFYVCYYYTEESKTDWIFRVLDSSNIGIENPYFVSDGQASNKIALSNTAPAGPFAFNIRLTGYKLNDIEIGFTVSYTNNSDALVENIPMVYHGTDLSGKNEFTANIAPKSGSQLVFKYRGANVENAYAENDANVSGDPLAITFGGSSIDVYLKDAISSHSVYATFPESSFTLYINDNPSPVESSVPQGWTDKALFEVDLQANDTVKIQWGYSMLSVGTATKSTRYRVYLHADNSVQLAYYNEYCLVGKINGVDTWSGNAHPFTADPDGSGQYTLVNTITLKEGDELKVRDGNGDGDWYPSDGGNYAVTSDGTYQIYFKPDGSGAWDWHYQYFYVAKL